MVSRCSCWILHLPDLGSIFSKLPTVDIKWFCKCSINWTNDYNILGKFIFLIFGRWSGQAWTKKGNLKRKSSWHSRKSILVYQKEIFLHFTWKLCSSLFIAKWFLGASFFLLSTCSHPFMLFVDCGVVDAYGEKLPLPKRLSSSSHLHIGLTYIAPLSCCSFHHDMDPRSRRHIYCWMGT